MIQGMCKGENAPAITCGCNYRLNENKNYCEDSFGHGGRERKGYNTGIQPLAISNWHLAITAFCRLEVSPFLGLKANCEIPSAASKRRFLSERVAREGRALGGVCDLHAHSFRIRSRQSRRPQHGVLAEHFAVHLGYEI